MSDKWKIKAIGNGYVVTHPYIVDCTGIYVVRYSTVYTQGFDEALELLKKNSLQPINEKKDEA